ncbi:MAG: right-handed parallel beta-helix repeat-containing protein [Candidatus Bathyarchaeota archaeon]|nr:right-handed parallel beta-helix repeat-containing protein [Candidatus Bathyarchaeota archaeon]
MAKLEKAIKRNRKLTRAIVISITGICIFALATVLFIQNPPNHAATDPPSTAEIKAPPATSAPLTNSSYPTYILDANQAYYNITTDGKYTYAKANKQLVYGGPGGVGGAEGTEAAAVLNSAVASLNASGGLILIQKGEYTLSSAVYMASRVALLCGSGARFILGYNGTMFEFSGVNDSALVGSDLYGNRDLYVGTPIVIKDTPDGDGSSRNLIAANNVFFSGGRGISVETTGGIFNNLSNNTVKDALGEGVMLSRANHNLVYGNYIDLTGYHGIVSTGGSYNSIIGNIVKNAGGNYAGGFAHGIAVDGNQGLNVCCGNVVLHNSIQDAYMAGIEVADGANNATIANNFVTGTGCPGIYFGGADASSNGAVISGNVLRQCGKQSDQGILISGASVDKRTVAVLIVNNVVDGAGADGIRIKWVTDATVTGNRVRSSGGYGLAFEDSHTDRVTIDKNNILSANTLGNWNLNFNKKTAAPSGNPLQASTP